jgi:hypothetical protein
MTRPAYDEFTIAVIAVLLAVISESWATGEIPDREVTLFALAAAAFEDEDAPMAARDLAALAHGALVAEEPDGVDVWTTLRENWLLLGWRSPALITTNEAGTQ